MEPKKQRSKCPSFGTWNYRKCLFSFDVWQKWQYMYIDIFISRCGVLSKRCQLVLVFHSNCNKHWLFKQNIFFIDLDTISFYFKSDVKGEVFPHNHLKLTDQFKVILIWFWSTIYKIDDLYLISKFCQHYRKYYAIGPSVLGWQKLNLFGGSGCL